MLAPRYFPLPGSLSMTPGSIGLVGGLLTLLHRPHFRKLSQPRTPHRRCHCLRIPARASLRPLAPSLWCLAPVVIREKLHGFSTSLAVPACKLAFLLGVEL